jgi:hypothetical protein
MELKVGSAITYVDSYGRPRPALITSMWTSGSTMRSVNVVVVNDDENQTDTFGRKIERFTSVCHKDVQAAPGNYWHE